MRHARTSSVAGARLDALPGLDALGNGEVLADGFRAVLRKASPSPARALRGATKVPALVFARPMGPMLACSAKLGFGKP